MTPAEYLEFERASSEKHEYLAGEIFAMAGNKRTHNLVVGNLVGELRRALHDRACEVYPSDMRVKAEATGLYTYPDVSAVCARPRFEDDREDTLLNPDLVIEVLSESTEAYDRGDKFASYRSIPSLKEYVLVSPLRRRIELFVRQDDGSWNLRVVESGDVQLSSVVAVLAVDEIYLKVPEREPLDGN
jgi:Uma2 family endonuclease